MTSSSNATTGTKVQNASGSKGKTLVDPEQQKYLIDMLNKLQAQQIKDSGTIDAEQPPKPVLVATQPSAGMLPPPAGPNSIVSAGETGFLEGFQVSFRKKLLGYPLMPVQPVLNQLGLNGLLYQQQQQQQLQNQAALAMLTGPAPTPQELMLNAHMVRLLGIGAVRQHFLNFWFFWKIIFSLG